MERYIADKKAKKPVEPKELKLLREWIERLGLQDWRIVLTDNVKPDDMAAEDSDGCVTYIETIKGASIQIVDPSLQAGTELRPFDYETVLVHELLHCKMALLMPEDETSTQYRIGHQILDDIARALVDAKRSE